MRGMNWPAGPSGCIGWGSPACSSWRSVGQSGDATDGVRRQVIGRAETSSCPLVIVTSLLLAGCWVRDGERPERPRGHRDLDVGVARGCRERLGGGWWSRCRRAGPVAEQSRDGDVADGCQRGGQQLPRFQNLQQELAPRATSKRPRSYYQAGRTARASSRFASTFPISSLEMLRLGPAPPGRTSLRSPYSRCIG